MDFDIHQLQKRIVESQLFDQSACKVLVNHFESESNAGNLNAENLAHWLCQQKSISSFQADILLTEPDPRLQYGNYQLIDLVDQESGRYFGRHKLTGHPVCLQFYSGDDSLALKNWRFAKSICRSIAASPNPNILDQFEPVSINEYRFIVSAIPAGKKLKLAIPPNARIPAVKAHRIVLQIANGLRHLRQLELTASIRLDDAIWVSKTGFVELDAAVINTKTTAESHTRQIAKLWYRISSGRELLARDTVENISKEESTRLQKYGFEIDLIRLLNRAFRDADDSDVVLDEIAETLKQCGVREPGQQKPTATRKTFCDWLQTVPGIANTETLADAVPNIRTGKMPSDRLTTPANVELRNAETNATPSKRTSKRILAPLLGSLLTIATVIGVVIGLTANRPIQNTSRLTDASVPDEIPVRIDSMEVNTPEVVESMAEPPFVNQILIADDQTALWESPTTGKPISFLTVPSAPKIAIALRISDLQQSVEGQRILKALGPTIESNLNSLEQQIGIPLSDVDTLLVTFHSNDDFEYDAVYNITLKSPLMRGQLLEIWKTESKPTEDFEYHFRTERECFGMTAASDDSVTNFVFGPEALVTDSVSYAQIDTTTGIMSRLVANSDHTRQLTVLALRSGLFNDEGQKLMGDELIQFNQQLARAVSNVVRGFSISLHIDNGTFFEVKIDQSADLTAALLKTSLQELVAEKRRQIVDYTSNMSSNSYWDNVRERVAAIAVDFTDNFRFGIENGRVVANGWFPASAGHNWVTSANLVLTYGPSQFVAQTDLARPKRKIPQSLKELLSIPRDLAVSTSPDLIILMNNLQQEILDDYGGLPFEFEIRLNGAELSKEGITQNQRPSDLDMKQQPLSVILTEIMVNANPDKNITGANDINCKMVWVVAKDPDDPEQEIILITTRAAAEKNSYALPAAFQPDS